MNLLKRKASAIKLGLNYLYSTDTFIVSFPKSGNTWLRFIIANMLTKETVTLKNVDLFVPDIYNFKEQINKMGEPRFIKSHNSHFSSYPKSIYIYRDYRDVLISYYHFQKGLKQFDGDLSTFINQMDTPFGSWKEHVFDALSFAQHHPNRMLFLSYEDMLENLEANIARIANFCSIHPVKSIPEIVKLCSFDAMQENESVHGRTFETPGLTFFRNGKNEQWRTALSENDKATILQGHRTVFEQLNLPLI